MEMRLSADDLAWIGLKLEAGKICRETGPLTPERAEALGIPDLACEVWRGADGRVYCLEHPH